MARNTRNEAEIIGAERERIYSILNSEEGLKRPKAAIKVACIHGLEFEAAKDFLKDMPVEDSAFARAMDIEGPQNIRALGGMVHSGDPKTERQRQLTEVGTKFSVARGYTSEARAAEKLSKFGGR